MPHVPHWVASLKWNRMNNKRSLDSLKSSVILSFTFSKRKTPDGNLFNLNNSLAKGKETRLSIYELSSLHVTRAHSVLIFPFSFFSQRWFVCLSVFLRQSHTPISMYPIDIHKDRTSTTRIFIFLELSRTFKRWISRLFHSIGQIFFQHNVN